MGSLRLLFVLVAVPLLVVAQAMIFDSPALDETVNGGRTYVVNMHTSLDDVSLSQLNNFELLLLSGKYGSSVGNSLTHCFLISTNKSCRQTYTLGI